MDVSALGGGASLLGLKAGSGSGLVGGVGSGLRLTDASLCAGINTFNVRGVLGIDLVELGEPIVDGIGLTPDPNLAREGIDTSPEAFLCGRSMLGDGCGLVSLRRGAGGLLRRLILLAKRRNGDR